MDRNKLSFRILVLITKPKLADKAADILRRGNVPLQFEWNARGTAPSELVDVLGLGSPDKNVLVSLMTRGTAAEMLVKLKKELRLGTVNSGIAFTLPISGANGLVVRLLSEGDADGTDRKVVINMADSKYTLIAAAVDRGYSENVMEAARAAGAGGGTVMSSRGIVSEAAAGYWGKSLREEKDIVLIVADNESKLGIMSAISEKCGMRSEAKGTVISIPIDSVMGFGQ